ncbi:MAG: TolC family protein [Oligoflexales bacterium]|nr:TolC family protein [Oligoflexales bacterium]
MVYIQRTSFFFLLFWPSLAFTKPKTEQGVLKILEIVQSQNNTILSSKQAQLSSKQKEESSGYFPDPIIKINYFGSPLETRNGPQRSNIMISQGIPWPSTLNAQNQASAHQASLKELQTEDLILELSFAVKSMVYKYLELTKKHLNKKRMMVTLNNLSKVVLGRLKLGRANQAEISRINIEVAKLNQAMRTIKAKKHGIVQRLTAMAGGKLITNLLPHELNQKWLSINNFKPERIDIKNHPYLGLAEAKMNLAKADQEGQEAKRLPKLGASISWFQIDPPDAAMPGSDAGKDAWSLGASISIPIWSSRYDALERSTSAQLSAAQLSLKQKELDLRAGIDSTYEEFRSAAEVSSIYASDIMPQAEQALKSSRESYTQGRAPFEQVLTNYINVIKVEDQLIENQVRQATLKAKIEKLVGKNL